MTVTCNTHLWSCMLLVLHARRGGRVPPLSPMGERGTVMKTRGEITFLEKRETRVLFLLSPDSAGTCSCTTEGQHFVSAFICK
ncbi:hypothetical protein GDO78_019558 [Eleutherodactylus coqui]|uniref:Secreted protein n=1 Tax=Eleutherodactylus coqui TaxID=57060 RepID=A0A8J6E685_ELECQ|nr:hypothetical protein GDO78_019558 [Eleutherodactylus coqui]